MKPRYRLAAVVLVAAVACASQTWAAVCAMTPGRDGLLIAATVLSDEGAAPGEVLIDGRGIIACVGPDCHSGRPSVARLDCPGAVLSPSFVNPHEHLSYATVAPRPDDGLRYAHRHDWRKGLRGHAAREFADTSDPDLIAWGELRHLLSGTTSMVGGAMAPGLVRNLDFKAGLEGLATEPATYATFPLDDAKGILRLGDCDYGPHAATEASVKGLHVFLAHVAEGADAEARNEFACLSDAAFDMRPAEGGGGLSHDILGPNLTIIHGSALTRPMLQEVARRGGPIVWSPRSNLSLYGQTLDVRSAREFGIVLALGTDWLPSGSMSMVREADCALRYSAEHLQGLLRPVDVWRMMTANAARAVRVEDLVGAIRPGLAADLILVAPRFADPYEAVVRARPQDLVLILRGGRALSGRDEVMRVAAAGRRGCEAVTIGGEADLLCIADDGGRSFRALSAAAAAKGVWPAFFDGPPPIEPACETRPK